MEYRAVVTDLDGTLCTDRKLHERDKRAIERTLEKDIPVIPATTRMRFSTSLILKELNIDRYPLICNNGARVLGPGWKEDEGYEEWYERSLNRDVAEELILYADKKDYEISTIFSEKKFWRKRRIQRNNKLEPDTVTELVENNIDALDEDTPLSLMMHSYMNGLEGLKDFESYAKNFFQNIKLDRHHKSQKWIALTVYSSEVSKQKALELVCEMMDIPIDEVLAIGDDQVDIGILKSAGKGIAMGNSPPSVKEIADEIAPSCKNQGVEWTLKKYILDES